jgi:hypothetical protein
MTNAKKAQDRIWAFHDGPLVGYFVGQSPGEGAYVAEFIRADLANTPSPDAVADAIWAEFKDKFEGERKFALRLIVRWLRGKTDE